jgi:hypothetical protein
MDQLVKVVTEIQLQLNNMTIRFCSIITWIG